MSVASVASTSTASSSSSSSTATAALDSLASNFNSFLSLLMTQLQNQDPTSPMDTNEFTQELVEFAGVQQQVNTNTNLTSLIQLTQNDALEQAAGMEGDQVVVSSSDIAVQNGSGSINFTAPAAEVADITVTDSAGDTLYSGTVSASSGSNSWSWDGETNDGVQVSDGGYAISVTNSSGTALPFTVNGTVTGVFNNSGTIDLDLGSDTVPLSAVVSVATSSG